MLHSRIFSIPNQKGKKQGKKSPTKTVTRPSARSTIVRTIAPSMRGNDGQVRVVHREFVGSHKFNLGGQNWAIVGRTDGYDINPASSALFPWLAPMAINFERYKFNSLKFNVCSAAATNMNGRIYLTADYDWDDPIPADKREFVNKQHTVSGPCWQDLTLTLNPKLMHADMPWKYVKSPSRADPEPRTNYGGFILVGCDAASTAAQFDFWVEYDVTLSTPQFDSIETEFLNRIEYNTSAITTPTTPVGGHILQPPLPLSGINFTRATIPNGPTYAGVGITNGVDIRKVNSGDAIISTKLCETGVSPAVLMGKFGTGAIARVYDALGNVLGDVHAGSSTAQTGVEQQIAVGDPIELNTAGAYIKWIVSLYPGLIKKAYNAAAYVAILNYAGSAIGAGKISSSIAGNLRPI